MRRNSCPPQRHPDVFPISTASLSSKVKETEREPHYTPISSAEVKNAWSIRPLLHTLSRDSFIFSRTVRSIANSTNATEDLWPWSLWRRATECVVLLPHIRSKFGDINLCYDKTESSLFIYHNNNQTIKRQVLFEQTRDSSAYSILMARVCSACALTKAINTLCRQRHSYACECGWSSLGTATLLEPKQLLFQTTPQKTSAVACLGHRWIHGNGGLDPTTDRTRNQDHSGWRITYWWYPASWEDVTEHLAL